MYKAVIFDLDGTLLDTAPDISESMNNVLERYNLPTHSLETHKQYIGNGLRVLVTKSLPEKSRIENVVNQCYGDMLNEYAKNWKHQTKPFPGIVDLLNQLTQKNVYIAILSNKENSLVIDMVSYCLPHYNFIDIRGLTTERIPKPDPTETNGIIRNSSIPKELWMYVGDSDIDMDTALDANIRPVFASWGYQAQKPTNVLVIKKPLEISTLF